MLPTENVQGIKLWKLDVDKIHKDREVIVEMRPDFMETITWQSGVESGREYDMRMFHYDIESDKNWNVTGVHCNGWTEIFPDDPDYTIYATKLKSFGLFKK